MSKKKYLIFAVIFVVVVIVVVTFFIGDKRLDNESSLIQNLYKSLGEVDLYHCGGLYPYDTKTITKDDISNDKLLCMAYHNLDTNEKKDETITSTGKNATNINICDLDNDIKIVANNEEETSCNYSVIQKDSLNNSYKDLYGTDIKNYDKFYITDKHACYLKGEEYICGEAETFNYTITPETAIYRFIDKSIKKFNDDIIIYDYFLKTMGEGCYSKNNSTEENTECSKKITGQEIDAEIIKKYGTKYKHTFKANGKDHYWSKTEIVKN